MMKWMQLVFSLMLASGALAGCYGHDSGQVQGGQSHWLRRCAGSDACGDDELCACGVCTRLCANDAACGSDSRCIEVGAGSSCEQAPAGIKQVCLNTCESNESCQSADEALSCVDRACMTPPEADAGQHIEVKDAGPVAGTGGSSKDAGAIQAGKGASGSAGTGGGTGGSTPTKPGGQPNPFPTNHVNLNLRLEGDRFVADVFSNITLYMGTCAPPIEIWKHVGETKEPPHDDRPPFYDSPGYYLDGIFFPPNHSLGCDGQVCRPYPLPDRIDIGEAYEYFKTGTSAPPPDTIGAPALVDVIERQPLSGLITIDVGYYEDSDCASLSGAGGDVDIPIPELGLCCPIGTAECSSEGPAGGWSDKLDHCKPIDSSSPHPYVRQDDPRGCPVLVEDVNASCSDADAGL